MKYLFLSPHPDDVELTCGATMSKLATQGHDVAVAVFSDCDIANIHADVSQAHDVLKVGITYYFYYPRRDFLTNRQDILDTIIKLRDDTRPDVVFIPDFDSDIHQDHQVIGWEGLRAFKMTADIIAYSHSHNQVRNGNNYFVIVSSNEVAAKMRALSFYQSESDRSYFKADAVLGIMRYYGVQCESEYAEAFRIIRRVDRIK